MISTWRTRASRSDGDDRSVCSPPWVLLTTSNVLQKGGDRVDDRSRAEPLAWLLHQPAVTAPIIGPRTRDQLTASQRALDVDLADEALRRLDEIWPGPSGEAPQAYAR